MPLKEGEEEKVEGKEEKREGEVWKNVRGGEECRLRGNGATLSVVHALAYVTFLTEYFGLFSKY